MDEHRIGDGRSPKEEKYPGLFGRGSKEVLRHVRFSRLPEFLEELRLQKATLALPYVRFTGLWRTDRQFPIIQHLTAVAGFWGRDEFIELREYCGQTVGEDQGSTIDRYQKLRADLLAELAELGIPIRFGAWTQGKDT